MKKGLLSLVLAPVILLSLVACGDKKDDPAPTSTPVATTSSTNAGGEGGGGGTTTAVSTVAEVLTKPEGTVVKVQAVVVAVTDMGMMIADNTGKIIVYLKAKPTQSVGDFVEVSGALGTFGGFVQFESTATITAATGSAPVLTETPTAWATADFTAYFKDANRKLGTYITFGGIVTYSGNYTNVALEGTDEVIGSIANIPSELKSQMTSGEYYNLTGYVAGVSGSKYVTVYLVSSSKPAEEAKVESVTVSCAKTTMITGTKLPLTVSVLPAAAEQDVTWTSSDTAVATVDADGVVTGVAAGTATITATSVGDTETVGTKATGTISITVAASTLGTVEDETYTWSSSSSSSVTLSDEDKTLTIATTNFDYTIKANNAMNPTGDSWSSLRWYKSGTLNIKGKSNQKIVKIVINMDDYRDGQYVAEPTYDSAKDATGTALTADMAKIASVEKSGSTYTIDFSNIGGLTELTYKSPTQLRIKSFTISYIA